MRAFRAALAVCVLSAALPAAAQTDGAGSSSFAEVLRLLAAGDSDAALTAADRMAESRPRDPETLVRLGEIYLFMEEGERAAGVLETARTFRPNDPTILTDLGIAHELSGRIGPALEAHYSAIRLDPAHPTVYNNLGKLLEGMGLTASAEKAFRKSIINNINLMTRDPEFAGLLEMKKQGGYQDFRSDKTALLTYYFENLAIGYLGLKNHSKAIAMFETAITIDPGNGVLRQNLEQARAMMETRVAGAEETGEGGKKPAAADDLEKRAQRFLLNGSAGVATAYLQEILALGTESASVYTNLGIAQALGGDYAAAARNHERATALDPGHPTAFNNLGHAYEMMGRLKEAKDAYEKAVYVNVGLHVAYENLANIHLQEQNYSKAAELLRQALEIEPKSVNALNNLAIAYHQMGKDEGAVAALQKGLEFEPDNAALLANLNILREAGGGVPGSGVAAAPMRTGSAAPALELETASAASTTAADGPSEKTPVALAKRVSGEETAGPARTMGFRRPLAEIEFPEMEPVMLASLNLDRPLLNGRPEKQVRNGEPLSIAEFLAARLKEFPDEGPGDAADGFRVAGKDLETKAEAAIAPAIEDGETEPTGGEGAAMPHGDRGEPEPEGENPAAATSVKVPDKPDAAEADGAVHSPESETMPGPMTAAAGTRYAAVIRSAPSEKSPELETAPRSRPVDSKAGETPPAANETTGAKESTVEVSRAPAETASQLPPPSLQPPPLEKNMDREGYERPGALPLPGGEDGQIDRFLSFSDGRERIHSDTYDYMKELPGRLTIETADARLWIYEPSAGDKGIAPLTSGIQPGCRRGSERVVYLTLDPKGEIELNVANPAMRTRLPLFKDSTLKLQPRLAPDNVTVAYLRPGRGAGNELALFNMKTKENRTLAPDLGIQSFDWTSDGNRIVFFSRRCGMDDAGKKTCLGFLDPRDGKPDWRSQKIIYDLEDKEGTIGGDMDRLVAHEPNGPRIVVSCKNQCGGFVLFDPGANEGRWFTPLDRRGRPVEAERPAFSPDGKHIAFLNRGRLWLADIESSRASMMYVPGDDGFDLIRNFCWN